MPTNELHHIATQNLSRTNPCSKSAKVIIRRLRAYRAADGIATETAFDRCFLEATEPRQSRRCSKVISIRALKRAHAPRAPSLCERVAAMTTYAITRSMNLILVFPGRRD